MPKKASLVLAVLGLLSANSGAQNNYCKAPVSCSNYSQWNPVCVPTLPPGAHNCSGFDFTEYCEIPTHQCAPANPPTCNCSEAGKPIDLATGNTYVQETDMALPGLGGGLRLTRTWNSVLGGFSSFGSRWSSNFEERLYIGDDYMVKYSRADGSLWTFGFAMDWGVDGYTPTFLAAAPGNIGATLAFHGTCYDGDSPYWTLTFKTGERRYFVLPQSLPIQHTNPCGDLFLLSAISDRNGNGIALTRDSKTDVVTSVSDSSSRHLYFNYARVDLPVPPVLSITSDVGVSLSYQYDSFGRLAKVIKPDNTFVTYEYNEAGMLTAVKDANGKLLESHTYDAAGRGQTSSRSGGVDSLTVAYQ